MRREKFYRIHDGLNGGIFVLIIQIGGKFYERQKFVAMDHEVASKSDGCVEDNFDR